MRMPLTWDDVNRQHDVRFGRFWKAVLLFKEAGGDWLTHNAFRFGASLAYFTVISLAPLVVITVSVLGLIFGAEAANAQFVGQAEALLGEQGAEAIRLVLSNAQSQSQGILATVLGVVAFLVGYTAVFFELQAGLNTMWDVNPAPQLGLWGTVQKYFLSFAMLGMFGFLLLVSLLVSSGLHTVDDYLNNWQPGLIVLWQDLNLLVSLAVAALLFAFMFKYIPDVQIAWRDVWVGAAITALLFALGKVLIGLYLGNAGIASSYGAAGSLVVLLIWIYYSAAILFFGAALTRAFASRLSSKIKPDTP